MSSSIPNRSRSFSNRPRGVGLVTIYNVDGTLFSCFSYEVKTTVNVFGPGVRDWVLSQYYCSLVIFAAICRSVNNFRNHNASCTGELSAMYSASDIDSATTTCFLLCTCWRSISASKYKHIFGGRVSVIWITSPVSIRESCNWFSIVVVENEETHHDMG